VQRGHATWTSTLVGAQLRLTEILDVVVTRQRGNPARVYVKAASTLSWQRRDLLWVCVLAATGAVSVSFFSSPVPGDKFSS